MCWSNTLRGRFLPNGADQVRASGARRVRRRTGDQPPSSSGGGEGSCSIGANATWSSANGLVSVTNLLADQPSQGAPWVSTDSRPASASGWSRCWWRSWRGWGLATLGALGSWTPGDRLSAGRHCRAGGFDGQDAAQTSSVAVELGRSGKHDIPEMHQPPGGSRTPAPLGRTSQLTASDAGVGGAGATTRAQQSNTDQQISFRSRWSSSTSSRIASGSWSRCHWHSSRPATSPSPSGLAARAALIA
jgi:hypothetical protein